MTYTILIEHVVSRIPSASCADGREVLGISFMYLEGGKQLYSITEVVTLLSRLDWSWPQFVTERGRKVVVRALP